MADRINATSDPTRRTVRPTARPTGRPTLAATVGAVVLTLVAGGAAMAANLGILGSTSSTPVGRMSPVGVDVPATIPSREVQTVYVDQYVRDAPSTSGTTSGSSAATRPRTSAWTSQGTGSAPATSAVAAAPSATVSVEHELEPASTTDDHAEPVEGAESDD